MGRAERVSRRMARGWVAATAATLLFVLVWLGLGFFMLALPPALGPFWIVGLALAFLWLHVWRPASRRDVRRLAAFRLRRLTEPGRFGRAAVPSVLLTGAGTAWLIYLSGGAGRQNEAWQAIDAYAATPMGWLAVALTVTCLAPLVEEFYFRGLLQRALERRFGGGAAVVLAAALFGLIHLHPWPWVLQPFAMGLLFGFVTHVTRSVWAGVLAHGAWNGTLMLVGALPVARPPPAGDPPWLLAPLLVVLVVVGLLGLVRWRRERGTPRAV